MNANEAAKNAVVAELRKQLHDWRNQRWVLIVVAVMFCAAQLIPGGTAPVTIKGSLLGFGLIAVVYSFRNWRGDPRLRLLLELQDQLEQHLKDQGGQSETPT